MRIIHVPPRSPTAAFEYRLPAVTAGAHAFQVVPSPSIAAPLDWNNVIDCRCDNDAWRTRSTEGIGRQLGPTQSAPLSTRIEAVITCRIGATLRVVFPISFATVFIAEALVLGSNWTATMTARSSREVGHRYPPVFFNPASVQFTTIPSVRLFHETWI